MWRIVPGSNRRLISRRIPPLDFSSTRQSKRTRRLTSVIRPPSSAGIRGSDRRSSDVAMNVVLHIEERKREPERDKTGVLFIDRIRPLLRNLRKCAALALPEGDGNRDPGRANRVAFG